MKLHELVKKYSKTHDIILDWDGEYWEYNQSGKNWFCPDPICSMSEEEMTNYEVSFHDDGNVIFATV